MPWYDGRASERGRSLHEIRSALHNSYGARPREVTLCKIRQDFEENMQHFGMQSR